jgi:hypothetical protein
MRFWHGVIFSKNHIHTILNFLGIEPSQCCGALLPAANEFGLFIFEK